MSIAQALESFDISISKITTLHESEANDIVKVLSKMVGTIENKLAELAVEHQINVHLPGPYGANRWVILQDEDDGWNDHRAGEWQASATSC